MTMNNAMSVASDTGVLPAAAVTVNTRIHDLGLMN